MSVTSAEIVAKNALKNYPSNKYQEEFSWLILQAKYQQMINSIEEKKLEVEVDFREDQCFVHADRDQINQVLVNLLDNALKFTPEQGQISLTTRTVQDKAVFRIADSGAGISAEDAPHIFDRFYKADKAHTTGHGTGLGLAICKRIIEKHNEHIELVNSENGAAFEFTLALAQDIRKNDSPKEA